MHPKQICDDFWKMGSPLILEDGGLYIEKPENVYPELEEFAKLNKRRIVQYLKGEYDHSIPQTIDKIVDFMLGNDNPSINAWLQQDYESVDRIMTLLKMFWDNGWTDFNKSIANFETAETDKLSKEIFDRAMSLQKGA